MSLINDALKRAKATQPKSSSAEGPALLRPDFTPMPRRQTGSNDFLLPALIVVILLLAGLLIWQWFRGDAGEIKVRARTVATFDNVQPAPQSVTPAVSTPAPVLAKPQTPATPAPTVVSTPSTTNAVPVVDPPATNQPIAVATTNAVPPPPAFKLQSIFYRAKSPSAVINGKTLFVGDRVNNAHVKAIGQDSVTIVTRSGETNILELP